MFGFSHLPELIIVLVIALVVFGPKRLPELGSSLGRGIKEFRHATNELHESVAGETATPLPPVRETITPSTHFPTTATTEAVYEVAPARDVKEPLRVSAGSR